MCIAPDFSSKQVQPPTNWTKILHCELVPLFPRVERCDVFQLGAIHLLMVWMQKWFFCSWTNCKPSDFKISPVQVSWTLLALIHLIWDHPFSSSLKLAKEFFHQWQCANTHTHWKSITLIAKGYSLSETIQRKWY